MDIEKFKNIMEDVCGVKLGHIDANSNLSELGLDSLDVAQLIFAIESELGISIDSDELEKIVTVGDALRVIEVNKG